MSKNTMQRPLLAALGAGALSLAAVAGTADRVRGEREGPYAVSWEREPLALEDARISSVPFCRVWPGHQREISQTEMSHFVRFDWTARGTLSVKGKGVGKALKQFLPMSARGIVQAAGDDVLTLAISRPGAYVLEFEGLPTLHVFADPPLKPVPVPGPGGRLIRFEKGEHHPGVVAPKSGDVVVLDEGAVVYGSLFILNATNVTVTGRGIFDGSKLERADKTMKAFRRQRGLPEIDTESACFAYSVYGSENVTISGVTFRDPPFWTLVVRNQCRKTLIDNIHIVGNWRYNSDGIDVCASAETEIRNSFIRTFDDCVIARGPYMKGEFAPVSGMTVTNCDLWADWGVIFKAQVQDFHGSTIEDVRMKDCRFLNLQDTGIFIAVRYGCDLDIIRRLTFEDLEYDFRPQAQSKIQKKDGEAFVAEPRTQNYLLYAGSYTLGKNLDNQRNAPMEDPNYYHFIFEDITCRRFRTYGENRDLVVHMKADVPRHEIRRVTREGLPPHRLSGTVALPRPEHPRPQFERAAWMNLNGEWTYRFDFGESGRDRGRELYKSKGFDAKIVVPFCPESKLSGVGHTDFIPAMWYHRKVTVPSGWAGRRIFLRFGAADWECEAYVDGVSQGVHYGGTSSFSFDVTKALADGGEHELVVRIADHSRGRYSNGQPKGKQIWEYESSGCYYTRVTGIWQTVWLEAVAEGGLESCRIVPDLDSGSFFITPRFVSRPEKGARVRATVKADGKPVATAEAPAVPGAVFAVQVPKARAWSPEDPFLYDIDFEVVGADGRSVDAVKSYAGLRKIETRGNRIYLNDKPLYVRFVLDQGYYPDGVWTAPSDAALKKDIELALAAGFNGARLHQKVFEERFHYWADRLGYLTWGESSSLGIDLEDRAAARNFLTEWEEIVRRDANHPSIIAWTPLNETGYSWPSDGMEFKRFHRDCYDVTKAIDPTRPVNEASGYIHVKTDLWTAHCYDRPKTLAAALGGGTNVWIEAWFRHKQVPYGGQPYINDEFGGLKWIPKGRGNYSDRTWGYGDDIKTEDDFYRILGEEVAIMASLTNMCGWCYTQLTDVEQEQNGVYNYDRTPKFDMKRIKTIFSGRETERPCRASAVSDAELNDSAEMNRGVTAPTYRRTVEGGVRVLFIGNSITLHAPKPSIGWTNFWGMAASTREKDFVHLVTAGIERETGRRADLLVRNLADFERGFESYDLKQIDDLVAFRPDYLVVSLGENVRPLKDDADRAAFRTSFRNLLKRFSEVERSRFVVKGAFWPNPSRDEIIGSVANELAVCFVSAPCRGDADRALGLFAHAGIANHPGDEGMKMMSDKVLDALTFSRVTFSSLGR